ncbi:hypothetical protein K488DRAFT_81199 [Vararia minispora EC-137]|uniref:Uncharacterized protein n=1 Tax=Vararia minispora EC-137 TaxID=1314806 RepID=A0ACB8Q6F3_9AGAM|nr:hypothetical protein K488DRAFT_81199 [Vararia minispora EC-137]
MDSGIHPNTKWTYHGTGGLLDLLQQKDQHQRNTILLHLNQTHHLVHIEGVLSTHKSILRAIASRRLPNIDQALRVAMHQGMSAMLDFAHLALGLPATLTVRAIAAVPLLQASPATPSIEDIVQSVDMAFGPLLHGVAVIRRPVHGTVGVDEIATEECLWWNDATNHVLGICREHIGEWVRTIDSYEDVEVLVEEMKRKVIHHAVEATVCAVTLLSLDTRLGSARPIAVSGTCKAEKAPEHRKLLQTMLDGIAAAKVLQGICIVCYASDGTSMCHKALCDMTTKRLLHRESNIFPYLGHLPLLNLWVGDDDLTVDKDYKHVAFKRVHNAVLRADGINVLGMLLTSEILCTHLQDESQILDLKEPTLTTLFNVADKQDVNRVYRLAFLIWELWCVPIPNHREATYLLRLSAAAHMLLALYFHEGAKSRFLPNPLFIDIMLMIKNAYFCVAKAKADNPRSAWFLIWMGTNSLESIFGVVRTMVGNDLNTDMLQLAQRLSHSVEVTNVFAEYKVLE